VSPTVVPSGADSARARGCVLGAALGDSLGAAFEFQQAAVVVERTGADWIDALCPVLIPPNAHGTWGDAPPVGTGTDDTRYNALFLGLAADLGHFPDDRDLARRILSVGDAPERHYPPRHAPLAREQFGSWRGACHGCLGEALPEQPDIPIVALRDRSVGGCNFPTLAGLISMTCAGALVPGAPDRAYRLAYLADFIDVAYGREAAALLAASISLAVTGACRPAEVARTLAGFDPFGIHGAFGGPFVAERLPRLLSAAGSRTGRELAEWLSRELSGLHPFDPWRGLAIAWAAVSAHPDDPFAALLVAVNIRSVEAGGGLGGMLDTDCYGSITGALAGAFCSDAALPAGALRLVVDANRAVYGIDLESICRRLGW
jgi:ADP-ribosylglycohydrolase